MVEAGQPFNQIREHDLSGLVVIVAVVMCLLGLGGAAVNFVSRVLLATPKPHDFVLAAGGLLLVSQTACVVLQSNHGLGKHAEVVEEDSIIALAQLRYASSLIYVAMVGCTKMSLCLLIRAINVNQQFLVVVRGLEALIGALILTGGLATAFQCPSPQFYFPETPSQCPAAGPIYVYIGVLDILTDIMLCLIPILMVWRIQTTLQKKTQVVTLFAIRLIVPIVVGFSIADTRFLYLQTTDDPTFVGVTPVLARQVAAAFSVITAGIPNMKSIFDSFSAGSMTLIVDAPYQSNNQTNNQSTLRSGNRVFSNPKGSANATIIAQDTHTEVEGGMRDAITNIFRSKSTAQSRSSPLDGGVTITVETSVCHQQRHEQLIEVRELDDLTHWQRPSRNKSVHHADSESTYRLTLSRSKEDGESDKSSPPQDTFDRTRKDRDC